MLNINFFEIKKNPKILCLGAHSDDIEIGCGGTILKLLKRNQNAHIRWIVFSANNIRAKEAQESSSFFIKKAKSKQIYIHNFKESYFPFIGAKIKDCFEKIRKEFDPDIIYTHSRYDKHQDHKLISNLTWNTFRDHLVLEYEIPKYDGDLKNPNFYVYLDKQIVNKKVKLIYETFKSQTKKYWFSKDTFKGLMRIRGLESNSPSGYSEAFHCHKICC